MEYPSKLSIVVYGDPILRQRAREIEQVLPVHSRLAQQMLELMCAHKGVGLAAPQVGVSERLFVMDVSCVVKAAGPRALANPVIVRRSGHHTAPEGCLSVPGVEGEVKRAWKIHVTATEIDRGEVAFDSEGFEARVIQHEIDHLDGTLFIDRVPWWKRRRIKRALAHQLAEYHDPSTHTHTEGSTLL